jgi:hypothetical protein
MQPKFDISISALPTTFFKKYEIISCIGCGGFGIILKAKVKTARV